MYFIPRNNKFYSWAAHVKSTHRYILTLFVTTTLFLGWWFFLYAPLENAIDSYQKQIAAMHVQYTNFQKTERSSVGLEQSIKDLQGVVHSYCVDCDMQQQDQLGQLLNFVEKSGLDLQVYNAGNIEDKQWYMCNTSHCMFAGSVVQFTKFLQEIQNSKQLIACENISLHRTGDDLFNITCDVQFFTVKKI